MNKKHRYAVFLFFMLVSSVCRLFALPTVSVYQVDSLAMQDNVVHTVDNLVFSFLKELKNYTVVDVRTQPAPHGFPAEISTDFIFFCSLKPVDGSIQFELVLKGREAQYTRLISKVYDNINQILLDTRMLVMSLFDFSVALENNTIAQKAVAVEFDFVKSVDALAGSWRGESGLDRIMILRGGRALAVFSSGVSASLECKIEDGYLLVMQKGAMQPRQFLDLPDNIAQQAAEKTKPPSWKFLVSSDKKVLSGTKTDAQISYSEDVITDISYATSDVKWLRN